MGIGDRPWSRRKKKDITLGFYQICNIPKNGERRYGKSESDTVNNV